MTTLELEGVVSGPLAGATLSIPAGLTVVLGTPADGTTELPLLLGGIRVPRRGSVRVAGRDPARSPDTRARLGLVLEQESPPHAESVLELVRQVLALRHQAADPAAILARRGLGALAGAPPGKLDRRQRRQLAFALALSIREPFGVIVHEPLGLGGGDVRRELTDLAAAGVPVLALTSSPRDASELGGAVVLIDRGRFVRRPGAPLATELSPGAWATLRVRSRGARDLVRALADDPAVASLEFDEARGTDEICVRGPDADRLSLAVLTRARAVGATLISIEAALPALEEVRAATEGLWRAAYDHAYRAATPRGGPSS
ncbi:MAG: hypothetical protein IT377_10560 [Polyangiaceae bacterium]|nr:hypothetical protein [Polyangiaceae bacterium]